MEQFISKSALWAEIEKLRDYADEHWDVEEVKGVNKFLDRLSSNLNTLEVKEVDLEKEVENTMKRFLNHLTCREEEIKFAKHFFELGMQASNKEQNSNNG